MLLVWHQDETTQVYSAAGTDFTIRPTADPELWELRHGETLMGQGSRFQMKKHAQYFHDRRQPRTDVERRN